MILNAQQVFVAEGMSHSEVMKTLQSISSNVGSLTIQIKLLIWHLPIALAIIVAIK